MKEIVFSSTKGEYGVFSNFSRHPVEAEGRAWPSSEHYYQSQKFLDEEMREAIRACRKPGQAAILGRDPRSGRREDWESVKLDAMRRSLRAKFTQHDELRELLLSTGGARIVEYSARDAFWGDGGDGSGRNMLGVLLMELRAQLRQEAG